MSMQKHFVTFYSPGTLVSEESTREIESWDTEKAIELAESVTERHGAKPYGFRFTTRTRTDEDLDSKVTDKSGIYYLGGDVMTLDEVKARNNPDDRTLILNMEINRYDRIVVNNNSWKFTAPLNDSDTVLNV